MSGTRQGLFRRAPVLALFAPFTLAGCGPAVIAGAILLAKAISDDHHPCRISGEEVEVALHGRIRFQERNPDGGGALAPVRGGRVEVLRLNCGEEVIASTDTGDDGSYQVSLRTPSGSVLRVAALAQRTDPQAPAAVRSDERQRLIYSLESADIPLTEEARQSYSQDLVVTLDCRFQLSGAFHVLEQTRRGFEAMAQAPFPPPDRPLNVLWSLGDPEGTFFSVSPGDLDGDGRGGDPFIQLRGGAFLSGCHNTDQFDDGIILHEFGHYLAYLHSQDSSPGGPHGVAELIDPRVAWSEGWADFFSCMTRNDPLLSDTSEVLRRNGQPVCSPEICLFSEFNLERKELTCETLSCCQGIGSEEAVGAFLWDIFDPPLEADTDTVQLPAADILLALEQLRLPAHHFVYVGDFLAEIEERASQKTPPQDAGVLALARREGIIGLDGQAVPFPSAFDAESRSGNQVDASASGSVDGCDPSSCKQFVENFIDSSAFYELLLPGAPGEAGRLTARLSLTGSDSDCDRELELRIFDQEEKVFYTTEGQTTFPRQLQFGLDADFARGSFVLVEVAGDRETPLGSGRGQKGSFDVSVHVE